MIYIVCPANIKTGGTELLHQLVYELNKDKIEAVIVYDVKDKMDIGIPKEFEKYTKKYFITEQMDDSTENSIIVPETSTTILKKYKNMSVYIWWLSVDHYMWRNVYDPIWHYKIFKKEYGIIRELFCIIKRGIQYKNSDSRPIEIKFMDKTWNHLVQSYYAKDFLEKHGVSNIKWLSDYINTDYLTESKNMDFSMKENYVAYNPNKGMKFTMKIIKYCKDVEFVPIVNMTNQEVIECLKKAKIYIDFGRHPGKDRIPREAACLHCCIITGKRGSAAYNDVLINDQFKVEDSGKNIKYIDKLIKSIFMNYEEYDFEFETYRKQIFAEKKLFEKNVLEIFTEGA